MNYFDAALGWAIPIFSCNDYAYFSRPLWPERGERACLARRQGKCPGLEYCSDCEWQEGTWRD